MPNVSVFIAKTRMPSEASRARFNQGCTELCTRNLRAAIEKVHIIYVPVDPGVGHDAYVEIKYREESYRTPDVMKEFLNALAGLTEEAFGCTTRLRCFGYTASLIHALN